jgi:hypothetical protein
MPTPFYLDAARMGLTTPSTQRVLHEFVRLTGEFGCTLYFERLLRRATASLTPDFPALAPWKGLAELKLALAKLVTRPESPFSLLAGRTAKLFELGTKQLARSCQRILVTDLTWPGYLKILRREARRQGRRIVAVQCRKLIFADRISAADLTDYIARAFRQAECHGVFLPHVSHDGLRLPVDALGKRLRTQGDLRCCVIDGAQALAHVPIDLSIDACDLYFGGCHKWLGAYLPLGVGFLMNEESRIAFDRFQPRIDDPLLTFLNRLTRRTENRFSETVNVTPLFSCRAALADLGCVQSSFAARRLNAELLTKILPSPWRPLLPHENFRCGILLVQSPNRICPPDAIRLLFLQQGLALTAYDGGVLRLSMPRLVWTAGELEQLAQAFRTVANQLAAPALARRTSRNFSLESRTSSPGLQD